MQRSTNVGLGDVLIVKILHQAGLVDLSGGLFISPDSMIRYRGPQYQTFMIALVDTIFKNVKVKFEPNDDGCIQNDLHNMDWKSITDFNLSKYFEGDNYLYTSNLLNHGQPYYVFNTKVRGYSQDGTIMEKINLLCSQTKLDAPIVLMGEKELGSNEEVTRHRMFSVYPALKHLLEHNDVIDLTETSEITNAPDFKTFTRDIIILSQCKCAFNIGFGGNYCMSLFFAPRSRNVIGGIDYNFERFANASGESCTIEKLFDPEALKREEVKKVEPVVDTSSGILLIQAGGHAKQCIDVFLDNDQKIAGVYDDFQQVGSVFYRGIKVIGKYDLIPKHLKVGSKVFCCIGDNYKRKEAVYMYAIEGIEWVNCISKHAIISPTAIIGSRGIYIGSGSRVLADSTVDNFTILNDGATVMHDDVVGKWCHLCPNSSIGGKVTIGDLCMLGTNATINPGVKVVDEVIIGSGAVVVKDILETGKTVKGVPAR